MIRNALDHLLAGRFAEAELAARSILQADARQPQANFLLGLALLQRGKTEEAIRFLGAAASLRPEDAHFHYNLGLALQRAGRGGEAAASYEKAVGIDPGFFEALDNLGVVLQEKGDFDRAVAVHRKAIGLKPENPGAWCNLGLALQEAGDLDGALDAFVRALSIHPAYPEALNNLGFALFEKGRVEEAVPCYLEALATRVDYPKAKFNLSLALLFMGNYEQGFEHYESRFTGAVELSGCGEMFRSGIAPWRGEDLEGKRILVWTEQGLGDAIMMLRYLPLMKGEIHVACGPELERLVREIPGVKTGAEGSFDFHCPIMSLPRVFRTTIESIPIPALQVPEPMRRAWESRLSGFSGPKVGLVWAGGKKLRRDHQRSMPFENLKPLLEVEGVNFFSLQKNGRFSDSRVVDLMGDCDDLLDTAAFISSLDIVISVDTAVAHLAGTIGKPVWLMNRFESEWRWMRERDDSPWYPSMRIFTQKRPRDWDELVSRMRSELSTIFHTGPHFSEK